MRFAANLPQTNANEVSRKFAANLICMVKVCCKFAANNFVAGSSQQLNRNQPNAKTLGEAPANFLQGNK